MTIRLVPFTDEHVAPMERTVTDADVLRFTGIPVPPPPGWVRTWHEKFADGERMHWSIVDEDCQDEAGFVGYAVTGPLDRERLEVELGYAVSPWARGRGVATAALDQLTTWALDEGFQRLVLLISTENPASSRVAAKGGYSYEGVLRNLHFKDDRRGDFESWSLVPADRCGS